MKFNYYKDALTNYRLSVRILAVATIALTILSLSLMIIAVKMARKTRVILVPPKLVEPVMVGDELVDKKYLITIGKYVLYLATNFTYENVDRQFNILLEMVAPENFGPMKSLLSKEAGIVKRQKIVQAFIIKNFKVTVLRKEVKILGGKKVLPAPPKGKIVAEGIVFRRISAGPVVDRGAYKCTLYYLVRFGQFQITGIKMEKIK